MNHANALTMITLGAIMVAAPHVAPDWFQPTAIDGSSTRALWLSVVGTTQSGLAALWLLREALAQAWQRLQTALPAAHPKPQVDADAQPEALLGTAFATATVVEPVDSVTLNGEYAELWRAFQTALASQGPAAQHAQQAVELARQESWSDDTRVAA